MAPMSLDQSGLARRSRELLALPRRGHRLTSCKLEPGKVSNLGPDQLMAYHLNYQGHRCLPALACAGDGIMVAYT